MDERCNEMDEEQRNYCHPLALGKQKINKGIFPDLLYIAVSIIGKKV